MPDLQATCDTLRTLHSERKWYISSKVMNWNRLLATVAGYLALEAGYTEHKLKPFYKAAREHIEEIKAGTVKSPLSVKVITTLPYIELCHKTIKGFAAEMEKLAQDLPAAGWVEHEDQCGFGLLSLAIVIGEAGNLCNYPTPGNLWARFGAFPYTKDNESLALSTWRKRSKNGSGGHLTKEEWENIGYSPKRHSVVCEIGKVLMMQNRTGPYRARWLEAKVRAYKRHPEWDWKPCDKCKAEGKRDGDVCGTCGGTSQKCARADNHGKTMAGKLLLKNLWTEWRTKTGTLPVALPIPLPPKESGNGRNPKVGKRGSRKVRQHRRPGAMA